MRAQITWDNVDMGDTASFNMTITAAMVEAFIGLTGDDNRLHADDSFARSKGFPKRIVHGALLAALFSRIVGKHFLGDNNLYLSQRVQFKKPVLVGECVTVSGVVSEKIESIKTITIQTTITRPDGTVAVTGEAVVKCL